jgi:hypothetical protein
VRLLTKSVIHGFKICDNPFLYQKAFETWLAAATPRFPIANR